MAGVVTQALTNAKTPTSANYDPNLINSLANETDPNGIKNILTSYQSSNAPVSASGSISNVLTGLTPTSQTVPDTTASTAPAASATPSISDLIKQQSQADLDAAKSAISQSVSDSVAEQQKLIDNAPQQYQGSKDQSEMQRWQDLKGIQELAANRGDNGGVNRMEQLQNNTSADDRLNTINLQENQVISDAKDKIAQLIADGQTQEAQAVAQNASTLLSSLISQANTDRTFNADQSQNAFNNGVTAAGLTGTYNGQQTMQGQSNAASVANTQANTAGQIISNQAAPAQNAANLASTKASTAGQVLQNQYYPQVTQANINNTNASTANTQANTKATNASLNGTVTPKSLTSAQITSQAQSIAKAFTTKDNNGNVRLSDTNAVLNAVEALPISDSDKKTIVSNISGNAIDPISHKLVSFQTAINSQARLEANALTSADKQSLKDQNNSKVKKAYDDAITAINNNTKAGETSKAKARADALATYNKNYQK